MMNMPLSSSGQLARYFVAGPLVLAVALGISGARAQSGGPVGPAAAPRPTAGVAPKAEAAPTTRQLPDGIKAYITNSYPNSTIGGYFVADQPSPKAPHVQYHANITDGKGERHKLYFNAREQLVTAPEPALPPHTGPTTAGKAVPRAPGLGNGLSKPMPIVYLDGERYIDDINALDPKSIANISIFKGDTKQAQQLFGPDANPGVIVITTIARQNDADVRAFNERTGAGVEKTAAPAPTSVPYLAAPALAYITQHYPAARLLGVAEVPAPDGGPTRYQAQIVIGRRPAYLLFDAAGQFISESYSRDSH